MLRTIVLATGILMGAAVALTTLLLMMAIAYEYLWGSSAEKRRDRREFPQAYALEKRLEQAFAEYPAMGNPTFALADIFPSRVARACLATGFARSDDPTFVLARRAPRPLWWSGTERTATLAVEYPDGTAGSFHISHHGEVPSGEGRYIRFLGEQGPDLLWSICSPTGRLIFTRAQSQDSVVRFRVRAE